MCLYSLKSADITSLWEEETWLALVIAAFDVDLVSTQADYHVT